MHIHTHTHNRSKYPLPTHSRGMHRDHTRTYTHTHIHTHTQIYTYTHTHTHNRSKYPLPTHKRHTHEECIEIIDWWRARRRFYNFASIPTRTNALNVEPNVSERRITAAVAKRKFESWVKIGNKGWAVWILRLRWTFGLETWVKLEIRVELFGYYDKTFVNGGERLVWSRGFNLVTLRKAELCVCSKDIFVCVNSALYVCMCVYQTFGSPMEVSSHRLVAS